jgi:hypothetical protein
MASLALCCDPSFIYIAVIGPARLHFVTERRV